MLDYFLLLEDDRPARKLQLKGPHVQEPFESLPELSLIQLNGTDVSDYVDWMERPRRIVSDRMKQLLEKYNRHIAFRRIDILDSKQGLHQVYWMMQIPSLACLSEQTELHPNGMVKQLVLQRELLKGQTMTQVDGLAQSCVIARLDVVESLLRRDFTGFRIQRVELVEGGAYGKALG